MYKIKNNVKNEIIVKKSRFICYLFSLENKEDINKFLEQTKKENKDYTHVCYGYIFNNEKKASDDNEPRGTAGTPILNVLEKNELTNTIAIVVRYFGKIKLGAGGLIRAYSKSVRTTLKLTKKIEFIETIKIKIETNYENKDYLKLLEKSYKVIKKEFQNNIIYIFEISKEQEQELNEKLKSLK